MDRKYVLTSAILSCVVGFLFWLFLVGGLAFVLLDAGWLWGKWSRAVFLWAVIGSVGCFLYLIDPETDK